MNPLRPLIPRVSGERRNGKPGDVSIYSLPFTCSFVERLFSGVKFAVVVKI